MYKGMKGGREWARLERGERLVEAPEQPLEDILEILQRIMASFYQSDSDAIGGSEGGQPGGLSRKREEKRRA